MSETARVLIVKLEGLGLPEGGDVADLIKAEEAEGKDEAAIRSMLEALAGQAEAWKRITPKAAVQGEQGWAGPENRPKPLGPAPGGGEDRTVLSNYYFAERWQPDTKKGSRARQAGGDPVIAAELAEFRKLAAEVTEEDLKAAQAWQDFEGPPPEELIGKLKQAYRFFVLIKLFSAEKQAVPLAKDIALVRDEVLTVLKQWPHRLRAPGAVKLFFDSGSDEIREITDPTDFSAMLKSYAQVKLNGGQDLAGTNYTTIEELYKHFGRSERVAEWISADRIPHEPPWPGHYCNWQWPEGYVADGRTLARLIRFFDQVTKPESKAILAASVLTPFWGGPYKERPAFVYDADQPGSGKTTAAEVVARVACPFGAMMLNLDRRSEERIKERLLSPEGRTKPVGIVDNVKGAKMDSSLVEELVTCTWVSGKELRVGESSRPNTMTYFITANSAHLSDDMTRRCFRVHFDPLKEKGGGERSTWITDVQAFIRENDAKLIADAIWMMRRCPPFDWTGIPGERNSLWVEKVLGAVLACPAVMEAVGSTRAADVLRSNQAWRDDSNEDLDEAVRFREGMYERLWDWKGYRFLDNLAGSSLPLKPIFVRTEGPPKKEHDEYNADAARINRELRDNNMVEYWSQIFTRPDISAKWLVKTLKGHIVSGRLKGLQQERDSKTGVRGWMVDHVELVKYQLNLVADEEQRKRCEADFWEKVKGRKEASDVSMRQEVADA